MRQKDHQAFVLLSTMFIVLVLGLVLRAAIARTPAVLGANSHSQAHQLALEAAESGLEYALSQIRESLNWRGGDSALAEVVVDQPELGLRVRQQQGNVIGSLTEPNGQRTEFRLRFNYQDGDDSDSGDGRPDPDEEFSFDFPYVSVNNLRDEEERVVPRGTGSHGRVVDPETGPHKVPGRAVSLAVEGRVLREDGSVLARRVVEAVYFYVPHRPVEDAAVMAGGGLDINVRSDGRVYLGGALVKESTSQRIGLRSKAGVRASRLTGDGDAPLAHQEGTRSRVSLASGETLRANYKPEKVETAVEGVEEDFYNLTWDQVEKTKDNAVVIPAGTYVYGQVAGSSDPTSRELRYYDMDYASYLEQAEALAQDPNRGVVLSENLAELRGAENVAAAKYLDNKGKAQEPLSVKPAKVTYFNGDDYVAVPGFQWSLTKQDLRVQPVQQAERSIEEIAIVPRAPARFSPGESMPTLPNDAFSPDFMTISLAEAKMAVPGDAHLQGGVVSKGGTLTSGGTVTIVSGRTLALSSDKKSKADVKAQFEGMNLDSQVEQADDGSSSGGNGSDNASLHLNLYARGNLNVSTYSEALASYRNLAFKGLLYSWGDILVLAGQDDSNSKRGVFTMRGAMVAYGADPAQGTPGAGTEHGTNGHVKLTAKSANLFWDPRFLELPDLQGSASKFLLERSLVSYPQP